ncbi:sugar ABC transporter ATP-binding protein [Shinella sp. S4-D37]|uniref:sugar ABC transporter ATP-binding protein n=1 Tax=Shinella sp. S4-D37 TaxID=3161999 RepID=UPI003467EC4D
MSLLSFHEVAKAYGIVPVLKGIELAVEPGEVLALVGENGAGKSTLMRIAAGLAAPTSGTLMFEGGPAPAALYAAERAGIVMVHQEFCLAPHLTVAENVFLGRELTRGLFTDRKAMETRARNLLAELGSAAPVRARLSDLPVSDWQMIELAKAFARQPKLILMDEPTAVLSAMEAGNLFACVRAFRNVGGSVIFTSHRLDEVKDIADRVAVLRDGQIVRVENARDISEEEMAEAMVGRPLSEIYPTRRGGAARKVLLSVIGLTAPGAVEEATLDIREGEVLGISGLVGSGRTELFEALLGLRPAKCRSFVLRGVERKLPAAREAWALKLAYLTEDRKGKGLLLGKSLDQNVALTKGAINGASWIDRRAERRDLEAAIGRYDIRTGRLDVAAGALSGGNQQKVLIAKTLGVEPDLIVFDEPTRGVDIGAKQQIYEIIATLAAEGKAIVVISSEMQEIVGLSDRVLVMRRGRITGELSGDAISETDIIRFAMGLEDRIPQEEASH